MNVVGHDAPAHEPVTLAVEVLQRVRDDGSEITALQPALADAVVEVALHLLGMKLMEPLDLSRSERTILLARIDDDGIALGHPALEDVLRE